MRVFHKLLNVAVIAPRDTVKKNGELLVGEPSRARYNRAARLPGARRQKTPFIVGRGPVPRHRSRYAKNVSGSLRSVGP